MSIDPTSSRPPSEGGLNGHATGLSTPQLVVGTPSSGTGTPIGFQRYPHNKHLDHVIRTPGRNPSPQPVHLGLPGQHRVLTEEGSGYISAKFEGKQEQMEKGKFLAVKY
jgi:glutamate dehydrogenase